MLRGLVTLLAASAALALPLSQQNAAHVRTPHGYMPRECVYEIPHHSTVRTAADGFLEVTDAETGKLEMRIPKCNATRLSGNDLPADYDGWEAYTLFKHDAGFDSFVGTFSVPDAPKKVPDILYLFTGLQNIDWIPKVDPEPSTPFDIIQPVLQYPGDWGHYWSVKSWYVVLDYGTLASRERRVNVGDEIVGVMNKTGTDKWLVQSIVKSSGVSTSITPENDRLKIQPWAYNTLECYGCTSCDTYPTKDSVFTDLKLVPSDAPSTTIPAQWTVNPKPSQDRKCNEGAKVNSPDNVSIFFNGEK